MLLTSAREHVSVCVYVFGYVSVHHELRYTIKYKYTSIHYTSKRWHTLNPHLLKLGLGIVHYEFKGLFGI